MLASCGPRSARWRAVILYALDPELDPELTTTQGVAFVVELVLIAQGLTVRAIGLHSIFHFLFCRAAWLGLRRGLGCSF